MRDSFADRRELIEKLGSSLPLPHAQWIVLTGTTSTWKSEVIRHLEKTGHVVAREIPRLFLETLLLSREQRCRYDREIRQQILVEMVRFEQSMFRFAGEKLILERGIPDQLAWSAWMGLPEEEVLKSQVVRYEQIFFLPLAPFIADGIRTEDEERRNFISHQLYFDYKSLGYPVIIADGATPEHRARFIADQLPEHGDQRTQRHLLQELKSIEDTTQDRVRQWWLSRRST